jgi:hypothetical protein
MKKKNYKEGFFRIHIILSVLWVFFVMVIMGEYTKMPSDLIVRLVAAFVPPIIIYKLVKYVYEGFKK